MPSGWCPQPPPPSRSPRGSRRVTGPHTGEQSRHGVVVVQTRDGGYRARSATVQERLLSHVWFPLLTLVERLAAQAPVAARGVAGARLLVTDGARPLYWAQQDTDLSLCIARIVAALDPGLGWPDVAGE